MHNDDASVHTNTHTHAENSHVTRMYQLKTLANTEHKTQERSPACLCVRVCGSVCACAIIACIVHKVHGGKLSHCFIYCVYKPFDVHTKKK